MASRHVCKACQNCLTRRSLVVVGFTATRVPNVSRGTANIRSFGDLSLLRRQAFLPSNSYRRSYSQPASKIVRKRSNPQLSKPSVTPEMTQSVDTDTKPVGLVKETFGRQTTVDTSELSPMELMELVKKYGAEGKRIAVQKDGEKQVLAIIPDDVRTYSWRSPEWTWGVMERLFQDCEQAKLKFEKEEYVDELDGKKKSRVKRDGEGQHIGVASGWWFDVIGLPKTFNTWVVVSFLHMWILKVRIRQLPRRMSEHWNELLTNHFFWEAEKTMDFVHKMDATQRKKYLDQYFQIWTGMILAYDEGLIKGDAVLAAAVWRMLFDADPEVEPIKIALVVAYMRREVARIGQLDDNIIARGYVGFGEPVSEMDILKQSPSMRAPFRAHEDSNAAL